MTVSALPWRRRVRAGQRKSSAVVVEGRIQPRSRVVALVAGLREVRRDVIRVRRSLEVFQVTGDAGCAGQVVIIVDVTIGALPRWNRVHAGEGEGGRVVVEGRIRPRSRVVALLTGLRESGGHMVGIGGSLIILQVAGNAGRAGEVVIVVDVAVGAQPRRHGVAPG